MAWSEGDLLNILEERLDPQLYQTLLTAAADGGNAQHDLKAQLVGVLYAVTNVCSGFEAHKAAVMNSKIPALLLQYLRIHSSTPAAAAAGIGSSSTAAGHGLCDVHTAAVWCVINLLWCETAAEVSDTSNAQEASTSSTAAARAAALKDLGYEDVLRSILASCTAGSSSAAGGSGAAVPLLLGDSSSQDLIERVQTALQLLQKLGSK